MNTIKYPRTFHFDFSPGISSDDKIIKSLDKFYNEEIIVTEKLDGENSSLYHNTMHARSMDGKHHPSRDWLKAFHAKIKYMINPGDRICGENMFAKHSIHYHNLQSYFYGFSYWSGHHCLSWDNTIEIFDNLGIIHPTILYRGPFDINILKQLANTLDTNTTEGFVTRVSRSFLYEEFNEVVAKWVRNNHVNTNDHWQHQSIIPNELNL